MERIYSIDELRGLLYPVFASYPVRKATLFGSYARRDADSGSDLDIVIDSGGNLRGFNFFGLLGDIVETLDKRVDLLDERGIHNDSPVRFALQKEGIALYEKS
ncbi:MAG: nucleotidyltransferase domain-containing protein [Oscillospiraceae bacterium]|nr:nucleotidyltransferase domain-containing protein [Oscillospiraceae bacterium]